MLFQVPPRQRPAGWPPTIPLPLSGGTGDLSDTGEVDQIKSDAQTLYDDFRRAVVRQTSLQLRAHRKPRVFVNVAQPSRQMQARRKPRVLVNVAQEESVDDSGAERYEFDIKIILLIGADREPAR